jgi:ubiquinone biosynthesis protein UbiJ
MSLFLKPFESLLNTTLKLDLETREKLVKFDRKQIKIDIIDLQQAIYISFEQQTLRLCSELNNETVDLTIRGKSFDLAKLGSQPDHLFSPEIEIHGNVQFAKQLQDVVDGFDFDWEQQLARYTGDTLAYPIAHGLRQTGQWLKNSHQSLQLSTAEYLREEIKILPDQSLINAYLHDIDILRADFDRLEARVSRLQKRANQ